MIRQISYLVLFYWFNKIKKIKIAYNSLLSLVKLIENYFQGISNLHLPFNCQYSRRFISEIMQCFLHRRITLLIITYKWMTKCWGWIFKQNVYCLKIYLLDSTRVVIAIRKKVVQITFTIKLLYCPIQSCTFYIVNKLKNFIQTCNSCSLNKCEELWYNL